MASKLTTRRAPASTGGGQKFEELFYDDDTSKEKHIVDENTVEHTHQLHELELDSPVDIIAVSDPPSSLIGRVQKAVSRTSLRAKSCVYRDEIGSLKVCPREFWIMMILKFFESFGYFATSYVFVLYLSDEIGYSDKNAGWAYGLQGMLISIYGMGLGLAIDALGVRWSLIVGSFLQTLGRLMLAWFSAELLLGLSIYIFIPVGLSMGIPVMAIAVRRYTNDENRAVAYGLFYSVMNIAALVSSLAVDALRSSLKNGILILSVQVSAYRALIFLAACSNFVTFVITLCFVREIDLTSSGETTTFTPKRDKALKAMWIVGTSSRFWRFMTFILFLVGVRTIFRHLDATFPKYMEREFGKDTLWGTIVAINPLFIIFAVPVISVLTSHIPAFKVIQVGTFISGISPFFLAFKASYFTAVMFVITLSIGEGIWSPRLYEYTTTFAEKGREGLYSALGSAPMFVTKLLVGGFSGMLLQNYCPEAEPRECNVMWLVIGISTASSSILITLTKSCIGPRPGEDRDEADTGDAAMGTTVVAGSDADDDVEMNQIAHMPLDSDDEP